MLLAIPTTCMCFRYTKSAWKGYNFTVINSVLKDYYYYFIIIIVVLSHVRNCSASIISSQLTVFHPE